MPCPPYARASFADGIDSAGAEGEGGLFSSYFTDTLTRMMKALASAQGIAFVFKCKLTRPILLSSLRFTESQQPLVQAVIGRFGRRDDLRLSLYDIRRARDTSFLAAVECAKAWRNVGGSDGSVLVQACESLLQTHLKLTGHSLTVAKQHYQQYGSIESAQYLADAKSIKRRGFSLPTLADSSETSFQKFIRFTGWLTLFQWSQNGDVSWKPRPSR